MINKYISFNLDDKDDMLRFVKLIAMLQAEGVYFRFERDGESCGIHFA
jgi:hypothetical protein